jgi:two-component SAPR family response regulator
MNELFSNNPKFIMIIDDNDYELLISNRLLSKNKREKKVLSFGLATLAIDYLKQNTDPESIPDIILCDIHMPLMTGFEFLETFEKFPDIYKKKSKIFLISSTFDMKDLDRSNTNPLVVKFYEKPLSLDKIDEILNTSDYFSSQNN